MIFDQKKDGSCDIIFSKEEIKIVTEYKKIHLNQEFLKHFSNNLIKICIEFNNNFNEETKKIMTSSDIEIIGSEPKK